MKKYLKILLILTVFVFCLASYMNVCYAENEEIQPGTPGEGTDPNPGLPVDPGEDNPPETGSEKLELKSIEVISPEEGIYGANTKVSIQLTFNNPIRGTLPKLKIYFGSDASEKREVGPITLNSFTNKATYEYTIQVGDNGLLRIDTFVNPSEYPVEMQGSESPNYIPDRLPQLQNSITANTTSQSGDFSNAKFEWVGTHAVPKLKIKDINPIASNQYYVYISHKNNENFNIETYSDITKYNFEMIFDKETMEVFHAYKGKSIWDFYAEKGNMYLYLCEFNNTDRTAKIVINGKEIERFAQNPLGARITAYFHDAWTTLYLWEPGDIEGRKMNVKIGKVSDVNILKAIKNEESGSLQKLLTYAKSANTIYDKTLPLGHGDEITSDLNLVDKEYYFAYMVMDDENGKYETVEDIMLYQAYIMSNGRR